MASVDPSRLGCRRGEAGHIDEVNGGASAVQHANEVRQGVAPVVGALLWPRNRKCSRRSPRNNPLSVISRTGRGRRRATRRPSRESDSPRRRRPPGSGSGAAGAGSADSAGARVRTPGRPATDASRSRATGRRASTWSILTSVPRSRWAEALRKDGSQTSVRARASRPRNVVETRQVVGRRMARLVEGKIDDHLALVGLESTVTRPAAPVRWRR